MQVTCENLSGLERKLSITVPAEDISNKVDTKLRKVATKAKMPGFRPGKVPFEIIKKKYQAGAYAEVLESFLRDTYTEAIRQEKLNPAGLPKIDIVSSKSGEPLVYTATFEIYPEVKINSFQEINVEKSIAKVEDSDVDEMLEKMRKSHVTWQEIKDPTRKSKEGDQITIDFTMEPSSESEDAKSQSEKDVEFVLGDGHMWVDFEKQLYDVGVGDDKKFNLQIPTTHTDKNLAGKPADFTIKIIKLCEPILPDLNDEFATKLHIKEGGMAKLREEAKAHMERELETTLQSLFKNAMMDKLLEHNPIEVPKALVENELKRREEEWEKRFTKSKSQGALEKIPEFPRNDFELHAKRSVSLGLLLAAIVKEHQIKVDSQEVSKKINDLVSAYYEDKDEMVNKLMSDQRYLAGIESNLLEEKVIAYLASQVSLTEKTISYKDAMAGK